MAQHSTGYIFGFAAGVCLICSVVVSGSAVALKDRQDANKLLDKQSKVLVVAGLMREGESLGAAEITKRFDENIVAKVVTLGDGTYAQGIDASTFDQRKATSDLKTSIEAPENNGPKLRRLPNEALVYQVMRDGKVSRLILPVEGKGLWSTLYGFVAVETDTTSISGLTFYEHGETPGLGGEVDNPSWKGLWKGRKAYRIDGDDYVPAIEVIKGRAGPASDDPYRVDGLSGATLTARGVTELMRFWFGEHGFGPYLSNYRAGSLVDVAAAPAKTPEKGGKE